MEKKVKFNYKQDSRAYTFQATDALGEFNPRGDLVMNFFNDIHTMPKTTIHKIIGGSVEDFTLSKKLYPNHNEKEEGPVTETIFLDRIIQATVVMTPQNAINLALWIITQTVSNNNIEVDKFKLIEQINSITNKENKNETN